MKKIYFIVCFALFTQWATAQKQGQIKGYVQSEKEALEFVNIQIKGKGIGTSTNEKGYYELKNLAWGTYTILVSGIGYENTEQKITLTAQKPLAEVNFKLKESFFDVDKVVITGTKTFKRQTNTPIIVNIIDNKTIESVQACNLSEGLKFQTGVRVETDCQTCNYTQLRMNGLGGGYSQILINGRPIFSPLMGLYGLEQIPANMIDRIEVVRGGGSALYGSSAIGGTVNVMTKIPKKNSYSVDYTYQNIQGKANDHLVNGNATVVNKKANMGASFFINHRNRQWYDANDDNYSELPALRNTSIGTNLFVLPSENQKLELSFSHLNEQRYGGEMVEKVAHLAQQSEERTHHVTMGNVDYQYNFKNNKSSIIGYAAAQYTKRKHYTGTIPEDSIGIYNHLANPPYGTSDVTTLQGGVQFNHKFNRFLIGNNLITVGAEYVYDDILDEIEAYQYKTDQTTHNFGAFAQMDWQFLPSLNLLAGVRMDKHNMVKNVIFSPRLSLMYKLKNTTQFRLTWGMGFRAPQAFDADMHMAFAGGGISRISLSPNLKQERSNSVSASVNFDKAKEKFIAGFTAEGFFTYLQNVFTLEHIGNDHLGELFEKRNGSGAKVMGGTAEFRLNYNKKIQIETGITYQQSLYDEAVENIEGLPSKRNFLRTPNWYGYGVLSAYPFKNFSAILNTVYTGKMELAHFAGAPNQSKDEYVVSKDYVDVGLKLSYALALPKLNNSIEFFGGVKNIFNAYQRDFDIGKNRDSDYIYGPSTPRTYFVGLKIKSN